MSDTLDKSDLAIRAKPRPVKRFSKKVLMVGAGGLALMLSPALAFALQPVSYDAVKNTELYNVTHKPVADAVDRLPKSYAELPPVTMPVEKPVLGPPLPGDLGRAYINRNKAPETQPDNPFRYARSGSRRAASAPTHKAPVPTEDPKLAVQEKVRQSNLFFDVGQSARTSRSAPITSYDTADNIAALGGFPDPGFAGATAPGQVSNNSVYNSGELESPRSPYQVMAGTLIPATLITGLNSDLPGQVIGQVTENIYDTVTGRHLLIPQGAKVIGSYESRNSYGDSRAFVTWSRLIFPNGNSMILDDLGAVDGRGFAGLRDKVDSHTGKFIKASVLSSILGVGTELASDDEDRIVRALQNSGQQTVNVAGQRMVDRSLNVEPTISIRPGWRFSVLVSRDLVLKPYQS